MRWIATLTLACAVIVGVHAGPQAAKPAATVPAVTPVAGPSWIHRLGISYGDTSLGRGAGRYGPSPSDLATDRTPAVVTLSASVTVTGADLYRINCQACHRAEGTGAPPEIKSVLPVVQGSSLTQLRGAVTRNDLYMRIEKGGQKMPARSHLQRADIDVLYTYLARLAGTGSTQVRSEKMSADRLGENVVKGTCHICHDASGPRPSDKEMLDGAIPPLSSLLADKTIAEFINKVERGAPAVMGQPAMLHRGRMPVFYYLTDNEIAAAYRYLHAYAPKP